METIECEKDSSMSCILIVDDDLAYRETLRDCLEDQGFTCYEASHVPQALTFLAQTSVDLVVTDFNMPGMDGLQLVSKMSECWPLCALPVIVMTGGIIPLKHPHSHAPAICAVLPKVCSIEMLLAAIEKALHPTSSNESLKIENDGRYDVTRCPSEKKSQQ